MINLRKTLDQSHLKFHEKFYSDCTSYAAFLQQWNKIHNLSGNTDSKEIEKNIIDSVWPLSFLGETKTLVDVGTGAGYPGLILAMALPTTRVYLVEPRLKRVSFLNFVKNSLKLENVIVIQDRIENVEFEDQIDLITSRAVTNTQLLIDLTQKIKASQTKYLFYKGSLLEDEIECLSDYEYDIIGGQEQRNYLYIKGNDAT